MVSGMELKCKNIQALNFASPRETFLFPWLTRVFLCNKDSHFDFCKWVVLEEDEIISQPGPSLEGLSG